MRFAAQVEFMKIGESIAFKDGEVVSALYLLVNYMTSVEYDIFNPNILESETIKFLPDGLYMAFMCGTMQEEKDLTKDGTPSSYIFLVDDKDIDIYRIMAVQDEKHPHKNKFVQRRIQPDKEEETDVHHSGQE